MDEQPDFETSETAGELNRDIEVVRRYFEGHPDRLVEVRVGREPDLHLAVLAWGGTAEHEEALRAAMTHPEWLVLLPARRPLSRVEEIRREVFEMTSGGERGGLRSIGPSRDYVDVKLRADQEPFARRLHEHYGDAVALSVGNFAYPPGSSSHDVARAPVAPPAEEISFPGLEVVLELSAPTVVSGRDGHGMVVLRNVGATTIEFESGAPLVGAVVDPGSGDVVGVYTGAIAGVGRRIKLAPGEREWMPMLFGTASTRIVQGYAVSPGDYRVRVAVAVQRRGGPLDDHRPRVLVAPPTEVTVVAS